MVDVFISYCNQERALTEKLASFVDMFGYDVWWDTSLLPHMNFRNEIDKQLDAARAVIIIWTPLSAVSDWVKSEADHARRHRKLINTYAGSILPAALPKPFDQIHAVPLSNEGAIIQSVMDLCSGKTQSPPEHNAWRPHFITEAIADALRCAAALVQVAELDPWTHDEVYVQRLSKAAQALEEPLRMFRDSLPFPDLKTYANRTIVDRLDRLTDPVYKEVTQELGWLSNYAHSLPVVSGARADLAHVARRLLEIGAAPLVTPELN